MTIMFQALATFVLLKNDLRHTCPYSRMISHFYDPQVEHKGTTSRKAKRPWVDQ